MLRRSSAVAPGRGPNFFGSLGWEERLPVPEFRDYSEAEVHYYLGLCEEAEYLVLCRAEFDDGRRRFAGIERLTWAGHEALAVMRAGSSLR